MPRHFECLQGIHVHTCMYCASICAHIGAHDVIILRRNCSICDIFSVFNFKGRLEHQEVSKVKI